MKTIITDDFILENDTAKKLYSYAKDMPIIDYHCHLDPKLIAIDYKFDNLGELFLGGDHYKWRMMRSFGVDEKYVTGDASCKEKFRAFAQGYIGQVKNSLTQEELDSLVLGAFSATVELAVRFLDDYINGDTYFKVLSPEHNLVRARCQLTLALDILKKYDQLQAIVREC